MPTIKYQRAIIGVEKKLGFLYVPSVGQELMPKNNAKIKVQLEGEGKAVLLSYNAEYKRIFGLTSWYKKKKIVVGTLLNVTINETIVTVSVGAKQKEIQEDIQKELINISGLSSIAKGNIVEDRIKELIMLYGQGLLNVYKPVVDDKGIDLIVMRDGVFMPIFLQVKSRFNAAKNEQILIDVNDNTFNAHHSFYVLGAAFNPVTLELGDRMLLIPSSDFESNATPIKSHGKKRVTVSLKENSKGFWTNYLISKNQLVDALMEKFAEMEKYLR